MKKQIFFILFLILYRLRAFPTTFLRILYNSLSIIRKRRFSSLKHEFYSLREELIYSSLNLILRCLSPLQVQSLTRVLKNIITFYYTHLQWTKKPQKVVSISFPETSHTNQEKRGVHMCSSDFSAAEMSSFPPVAVEYVERPGFKAYWVSSEEERKSFEKVVLYSHGGGFCVGFALGYQHSFKNLISMSRSLGVNLGIFSVEYSLAPQHPFPTAIKEIAAAYEYLIKELHYTTDQIVFSGDSAGGNLAAATCLYIKENRLKNSNASSEEIASGIVLISPWLNLKINNASYFANYHSDWISGARGKLVVLRNYYLGIENSSQSDEIARELLKNPLLSPCNGDLRGMPSVFMIVGSKEIFADECIDFARKARAANVNTRLLYHSGMVAIDNVWCNILGKTHIYPLMASHTSDKDSFFTLLEMCLFIKEAASLNSAKS